MVASFDQVDLRVLSVGQGSPMVFVPGVTMTAEIWQQQIDVFSKDHRVIAFDPRGQGQSGKPETGYDSESRAKDIHEILRQLDLKNAVLTGWSLGAIDVVSYLQLFGADRLSGIVLVDNSVDKNYASGPVGLRLQAALRSQPYEDVIKALLVSMFRTPLPEGRLAELQRLSLLTPVHAAREALARADGGMGLADALKKTGLPAIYAVTPRFAEEGRKLKAVLGAQLRLEIFEAAGHALFADEAKRFNQCIQEEETAWLARH